MDFNEMLKQFENKPIEELVAAMDDSQQKLEE